MPYKYKREALTADEVTRLVNACQSPLEKIIVWTLLDTGLRVSELSGLTREHIDFQRGEIVIPGTPAAPGENLRGRAVPMTARVRGLLEPYFAINDRFDYSTRQMERVVRKVGVAAGIRGPVSPQVLRRTFATSAFERGMFLPTLQKLLGHDSLSTTANFVGPPADEPPG
jgi:integrase/recombinase XerD